MNHRLHLGSLAVLTAAAFALSPALHAQSIPSASEKTKKKEEPAKKPEVKPEDWKTNAPDTTGLNFKGQKNVLLAVATDENGKLTKADIAKSSGDAAVDQRVSAWAMKHWSGPKSAKAKIPVAVGK